MQGGKNFICTAAAKTVSKTFNRKKNLQVKLVQCCEHFTSFDKTEEKGSERKKISFWLLQKF